MAKRRLVFKPRPCVTCGREFTPVSGRQRFCSPVCGRRMVNGKRVPRAHRVTCAKCGREFVTKNSRQVYCSATCKAAALRHMAAARPPRDTDAPRLGEPRSRVCPICGAEFEGFGKQVYCSLPCRKRGAYLRSRAKQPPKPKRSAAAVCPICGQAFESIAPSGQRKKFCSPQCRNEANRRRAWERGVILRGGDPAEDMKHACVVCGATFLSRRPHARFCSDACRAVAAAAYQRRHYRERRPEEKARNGVGTCPICGTVFRRNSFTHRYCSERCRDAAYRRRHHLAPGDRDRECASCGETFESIDGRVCCTRECSRWHARHHGQAGPWPYTLRECAQCGEEFRAFSDEEALCAFCSANGKTPRGNGRMGEFVRKCHDCGRPTTQYRCPSCLARWRKKHGVSEYAVAEGDDYA